MEYKIVFRKGKGKIQIRLFNPRWEDNIKFSLTEIACEVLEGITCLISEPSVTLEVRKLLGQLSTY